MSSGPGPETSAEPGQEEPPPTASDGERYHVDASGARGIQVTERGTQNNYFYRDYAGRETRLDGDEPVPYLEMAGKVTEPYRGLRAFGERDAALYFGRDDAATAVLRLMSARLLEGPGLVVVSGVSGAGKSSLLRAGVMPRLKGAGLAAAPEAAGWPSVIMAPSGQPLRELAVATSPVLSGVIAGELARALAADPAGFALTARQAALSGPDLPTPSAGSAPSARRLLIVVDQCEQLFTQCAEDERHAFIEALYAAATTPQGAHAVPAALVVVAIRNDFEARLAEYRSEEFPGLARAVQDRYLLTSMTERQLRMAITEPTARAGASVDEDLVRVLLAEMRTGVGAGAPAIGAGALPLLSHALAQTWLRRAGPALTLADYERTGGVQGAVAVSAQLAYDGLTAPQQAAARRVLIRLTATTADGLDTAARVPRADLTAGLDAGGAVDVEAVMERFTAARLFTVAADTVEISHEALLTAWPLLRDTWLAQTHEDRIARTRLRGVAAEWNAGHRDPSYLYRGSRLREADEATARIRADAARHSPLSPDELDFLRASRRADHRRRVLRWTVTVVVLALVAGVAAISTAAIRNGQQTAQVRDVALAASLADESVALGTINATDAQLESLAAWGVDPNDESAYALAEAAADPETATIEAGSNYVNTVAISPNGAMLATGDEDGTLALWSTASGRSLGKLIGGGPDNDNPIYSLAFSPDGGTLAVASSDGLQLWSVRARRPVAELAPGDFTVSVAFGGNGSRLAAAGSDGTATVWNTADDKPVGRLVIPGPSSSDVNVALSADGTTLATTDGRGDVELWNLASGRVTHTLSAGGGTTYVLNIAFSPVGDTLATSGIGGTRLWQAGTGRLLEAVPAGSGQITSVAFSPNGTTVATGDSTDTAVWNVSTDRLVTSVPTGTIGIDSVAFGPGGTTLATGGDDGNARLWRLSGELPTGSFPVNAADTSSAVAFSPNGRLLAAVSGDTVQLWNAVTDRSAGRVAVGSTRLDSVAFNRQGTILATGDDDGVVRLFSIPAGRQLRSFGPQAHGLIASLTFTRSGGTLAVVSGALADTASLWNVATGRLIRTLPGGLINSVAFSPSGATVAVADRGPTRLWSVASGTLVKSFQSDPSGIVSVAFSPDGTTLATSAIDGTAQLWDVATGQEVGNPIVTGGTNFTSVTFSPNGQVLATGDYNDTTELWNSATGEQVGVPISTGFGTVTFVAFSPDGSTLATVIQGPNGHGDVLRLWNVGYLQDALGRVCTEVGGTLTVGEWNRYVQSGPSYRNVCAQAP